MALIINGLLIALLVLYPLVVYFGLQYWDTRTIAVFLAIALILRALLGTGRNRSKNVNVDTGKPPDPLTKNKHWLTLFGIALLVLVFAFNDIIYFQYYPLTVNLVLLLMFSTTLLNPPSMVERLARLQEPELPDEAIPYTRRVTQIWCVFFIVNAAISFYTACCMSLDAWTLYNGLIAYLLIGLIFTIEWLTRQFVRKKHKKTDLAENKTDQKAKHKSGLHNS
jgi:uncharacterized membrane protein